jgi:hypothetical protein
VNDIHEMFTFARIPVSVGGSATRLEGVSGRPRVLDRPGLGPEGSAAVLRPDVPPRRAMSYARSRQTKSPSRIADRRSGVKASAPASYPNVFRRGRVER